MKSSRANARATPLVLHRTSSLADAISMLVVELERQFMHMHPCIQRIFLEFSNIEHSSVKRDVTIFLVMSLDL